MKESFSIAQESGQIECNWTGRQAQIHRFHLLQTIQSLLFLQQIPPKMIEEAPKYLSKVQLPDPIKPDL